MRPHFKRIISIVLPLLLVLVLIICNLNIVKEARNFEEYGEIVRYQLDRTNTIAEHIKTSAPLYVSNEKPTNVVKTNDGYFIEFEHTLFGTLSIEFEKPLEEDISCKITLSEKSISQKAWTRNEMSKDLNGFGINFISDNVIIPRGSLEYTLALPQRPLPVLDSIQDSWTASGVIPFCCCQIDGYDGPELTESNIVQTYIHSDIDMLSSEFYSDNSFLNEIYDFCKDTIYSTSYGGVYVDGYREMIPYEADSYINELSNFAIDDNYDLARATILNLVENHTWPTEWVLQTIPLTYDYYMYSGDQEIVRQLFDQLEACSLSKMLNSDGLIDSNMIDSLTLDSLGVNEIKDIIDWPPSERFDFPCKNEMTISDYLNCFRYKYMSFVALLFQYRYAGTEYKRISEGYVDNNQIICTPNAVVNAFYYKGLNELSFLAEEIGKKETALDYRKQADAFKLLYQKKFINGETGLIVDIPGSRHSSLHSNMFALDFGLVPDDIVSGVVDYIKTKGMGCSVYGSQFLLEALIKYGAEEYALDLITSTGKRSWYNMIYRTGSKLTTEAWDEHIKANMDWNHPWGTAALNIITRYIVGVQPYSSGCETVSFAPHFGSLDEIKAKVPINNGHIEISYMKRDGYVNIELISTCRVLYSFPGRIVKNSIKVDDIIPSNDSLWIEPGTHHISYMVSD